MEVYKVLFLILLQSSVYFLECESRPFVFLIPYIVAAASPALTAIATYSGTTAGAAAVAGTGNALLTSITGSTLRSVLQATQTHTTTAMTAVTPALANTASQITNLARERLQEQMKPENLQEVFKSGSQYMNDNPDAIQKHIGLLGQIRNHMDFIKSQPALEIRFTDDTSEEYRRAHAAMMDWRKSKNKHKYLTNAAAINPHHKELSPIEVEVKRYPMRQKKSELATE